MTNLNALPFLQYATSTWNHVDWNEGVVFLNNNAQSCVMATIAAPGAGYTNGTQTLTIIGGNGTPTQINALVVDGAVVALTGFAAAGLYRLPPASTNVPTAAGGGTGCFLNLQYAGSPIDLTGIFFHSEIKSLAADTTAKLDLSTSNGLMISGGVSGALNYAVPAATMLTLAPGTYVTDIIASDASGAKSIIASIAITHQMGVTR